MTTETQELDDQALEIGDDVPGADGTVADDTSAVGKQDQGVTADLSKLTDEQIKALPEDAQQAVRGFQADYTRKTQQLAEDRRKLEEKGAYAGLAEEVEQLLNEDGPEAAARYLREAARQLYADDSGGTATGQAQQGAQAPQDQIMRMAQEAYQIANSADADPTDRALAQGLLQVLQVNAALAHEVQQVKATSQSGLREFANREIEQTLTVLHQGEYNAVEPNSEKFNATVLRTAQREGMTNLRAAAKLAYADALVEKAKGQAAARASEKAELPDASTGLAAPTTQGQAKTVGEAFARAKARLAKGK